MQLPSGAKDISFITLKPAVGSTQPLVVQVPGVLSRGIKWPGLETDHSTATS